MIFLLKKKKTANRFLIYSYFITSGIFDDDI